MIESLYNKYFQKSRSFLYPALGIRRSSNTNPTGTYVSLEGKVGPEDIKLVCVFQAADTDGTTAFESQMLLSNPLFEYKISVGDFNIYVFDYQIYKEDWFNFLLGKYSKLSPVLKKAIKTYYGEDSSEYKYIDSFLFPERHYSTYARLLNVTVDTLKTSGELCDPCDLEKETLKIPVKDLQIL